MKIILQITLFLLILPTLVFGESKEWKVISGKVFFKSETDLETILGEGQSISGKLDLNSKSISIDIALDDIKTQNKLQNSHLHDNYLESAKFPVARFRGTVDEVKESGEVKAKGTLELHGVTRENITLIGKIQKNESGLELISYFPIRLTDYGIEVPKLLFLKVNQEIQMKVKIQWKSE